MTDDEIVERLRVLANDVLPYKPAVTAILLGICGSLLAGRIHELHLLNHTYSQALLTELKADVARHNRQTKASWLNDALGG